MNQSTGTTDGAAFKMLSWAIPPGAAPDNLKAYMTTSSIGENQPTTIVTSWALPRQTGHYLGMVEFKDFREVSIGGTMVSVEIP